MKDIEFCGHTLILHSSGMLIWPDEKLAVAGDLHLEKGSYFAQNGQFLPPQDSAETLSRLLHVLEFSGVQKLLLLGDSVHDAGAFQRMGQDAKALFDTLARSYEILWITGNHDGAYVPENVQGHESLKVRNITFRHEALNGAAAEISAHFHPKARLTIEGKKISRPCFMVDASRIIIPAFGALTGGLDTQNPALKELFTPECVYYLLGKDKLYTIPSRMLVRP